MPAGPWWRADKLIHATEYAILAALLVRALVRGPPRLRVGTAALVAVACALAFGASDEWHQSFVPGRSSSAFDAIADGVGACLGAALATFYYRRRAAGRG